MYSYAKMMIKRPIKSIKYFCERIGFGHMRDREYVEYLYERMNDGRQIDIDNPLTYDDKLNWMKIYDRNPIYTTLADKLKVKEYVSAKVGKSYVIPLIREVGNEGVWTSIDNMDFSEFPDRFVIKTNHDCGGVFICRDKESFDLKTTKKELKKRLKENFWWHGREWVYKDIERKIFCEEYIEGLSDNNYKFFCFDGKPIYVYVAPFREKTVNYFDMGYNSLDIYTRLHSPADITPQKPECFEEMKEIAQELSKGIRAVRVDLYEVYGKVYFGEMTFYHEAGFTPFIPEKWNKVFGDLIQI